MSLSPSLPINAEADGRAHAHHARDRSASGHTARRGHRAPRHRRPRRAATPFHVEHRAEAAPPQHARSVSHAPRQAALSATRAAPATSGRQSARPRPFGCPHAERAGTAVEGPRRAFAESMPLGTTTTLHWTPPKTLGAHDHSRSGRRPEVTGPHGCPLLPRRHRAPSGTRDHAGSPRPAPGSGRLTATRPPTPAVDPRDAVSQKRRQRYPRPRPLRSTTPRIPREHGDAALRRRALPPFARSPTRRTASTIDGAAPAARRTRDGPPRIASVRGARGPRTANLPWRTHRSRSARRAGTQCARTVPTTTTPRRTMRPPRRSPSRPLGTSVDPRAPVPRETENWPEAVIIRAPHPRAPAGARRPPPRPPRVPAPSERSTSSRDAPPTPSPRRRQAGCFPTPTVIPPLTRVRHDALRGVRLPRREAGPSRDRPLVGS